MEIPLTRIGLVGSTGFIGRNVVSALAGCVIDLQKFNSQKPILQGVKHHPAIRDLDTIIWCASRVNPISARTHPWLVFQELHDWNLFIEGFNTNVYEDKKKIIFLSSGGCVYSDSGEVFNEYSEALGINEYGKMKVEMEQKLIGSGLDYVVLRVANAYGKGQPQGKGQGVIAEWIHSFHNNRVPKLYGSGDSFRDYVHVDDVANAVAAVLVQDVTREVFNVGSGVKTKLNTLIELLVELTSGEFKVLCEERRTVDRIGYYLETSKIEKSTNWHIKRNLREGISELLVR